MRAVALRSADVELVDVPAPSLGPGKVLIAPHAVGICGSDLHAREVLGAIAADAPELAPLIVPGHEFAGEVIELDSSIDTDLAVGDRVAVNPFVHGAAGPETVGLSPTFAGGLAELVAADAVRTVRLPDRVAMSLGALSEPVAVATHAFGKAASEGPVVVIGAGPIGLGILAVAVIADRHPLIVIEPTESRRAMAHSMGADVVAEPGTPIVELLADVGYTVPTVSPLLETDPTVATIFECVGRAPLVQSLLAEAPGHSRVVLAGACPHAVQMEPLRLTTSEVTVETSYAYLPSDFSQAIGHVSARPELFERLITSRRPLADAADAFDALASDPSEIKILIDPRS